MFCNEVKGKSALAMSRDLGVSYKSAFVLLHKMREAMAEEMKGRIVGGEGKVAEVDGGYFGGYVKPANHRENRRDRRFAAKPNRQAPGRRDHPRARRRSVPAVFSRERSRCHSSAPASPRERSSTPMRRPHGMACMPFEMKRINHEEAY